MCFFVDVCLEKHPDGTANIIGVLEKVLKHGVTFSMWSPNIDFTVDVESWFNPIGENKTAATLFSPTALQTTSGSALFQKSMCSPNCASHHCYGSLALFAGPPTAGAFGSRGTWSDQWAIRLPVVR
jgi:hypothetical protein